MRHRPRFPRLKVNSAVKITARILHCIYNNLGAKRILADPKFFDIAKTRRGKYANLHFLLLATELIERKIEPVLYLKVMSKYGRYADAKYLPATKFLASEKALDIFDWLLKKEMRHHISADGWKDSLGSFKIDEKKILEGVDMSRKHVETVKKATGLRFEDIILTQQLFLSPWYLAVCPSYLAYEVKNLTKEDKRSVVRRVHYMLNNKGFGRKVLEHARTQH
jgi:hypothetical protein